MKQGIGFPVLCFFTFLNENKLAKDICLVSEFSERNTF